MKLENTNIQELEESVHLSEYYHILTKRKWIVIACFVLIVSLTLFFTLQMTPVYEASATLIIDKAQTTSPLTGERMDFESYISQSLTFNTHFKLITSRPILEKVIRSLKLDQIDRKEGLQVGFLKTFLSQFRENIRLLIGQEASPGPQEKLAQLVENLLANISIEEVRDTRLMKINVEDYDPAMARDICNELADAYIKFDMSGKLTSSKNTLSWLTDQLYEMKKKVEGSEAEFQAYKQEEKIFSIEGKQKVITQKIEEFNDAYLKTRNERLEMDEKLKKLGQSVRKKGNILHARSLIENALVDNFYTQLLEAEVELDRLSKVFKSRHPKIVQISSKIANIRKKLDRELRKEIENLKVRRSILFSKEDVLAKTVDGFENDAMNTNKKELRYSILKRNADTNQKLYDILLSKIKEADIEESLDVSNIRIAEAAALPLEPVKPRKKLNFILSVILGLMTGVGFSFLTEYMDRSVRTEEDVMHHVGLPVLSVIPKADKRKAANIGSVKIKDRASRKKSDAIRRIFIGNHPPKTRFAEAYRTLRVNIAFSAMEKEIRSVLITSAGQGEGKTSTAANLAYTMSQAGKRVLLVDADLRRPSLNALAPEQESPGLTGLISDILGTPMDSGSLEDFGINDLFTLISLQKKTGCLELSDGEETVEIFFSQGKMKHADWPDRPEQKKLGQLLVKEGKLSREHAEAAYERRKYGNRRIGSILISMGFLKPDDLTGPLTLQMMECLRMTLEMKTGTFRFREISEFQPPFFQPVDLNQLCRDMAAGREAIPYLQEKIDSAIGKSVRENLFLLSSGMIPPNPSELVGSEHTAFLISYLKKRFDLLIIDTPPVLPASDALVMAPLTDVTVLVIKAEMMNRELIRRTVDQLRTANVTLAGVAFNQVDTKREGYYKYYHKYYSRYYGERG